MNATANLQFCPTCGEDEAFTGTCGTSDHDLRALCKQGQPVQPAFDVEKTSVRLRESLYDVDYSDYLELIRDEVSSAYTAGREAIAQPVQHEGMI